ncbi:hypothetical protein [Mucilaginibacter ginsenosidivorax]|uniref:Uncharacterized protein n=1 Tax=Mucilaginibacter ginsenosidivorax TaxID=862126 RepID=A0A5B8VSU1_9SPHI|nr:hypothetical protein [Mucilaginibacter ginsenosidivorax]QEC74714.1 hypothetical protein FSB76_01650 [Mucilaginibacter ginsenosidivorax]
MAVKQRFEIIYKDSAASVVEYSLRSGRVFRVKFMDDALKPLVVTVARDADDKKFWTSVPEGRQQLAAEIGKLIATYIRNYQEICVTITVKKSPAPSLFD